MKELLMELFKIILPILCVYMGWRLAERGKLYNDKKQDARKLNKLLYYLLELRFRLVLEFSQEAELDKAINFMKIQMAQKFGVKSESPEFMILLDEAKPILKNIGAKHKRNENNLDLLNENIENVLTELAEIFPILAYELSGLHNVKERLGKANAYLDEFESLAPEIPFDLKEIVNPRLSSEILKDLDASIVKIAKLISDEVLDMAKGKLDKMNDDDTTDAEEMIAQFFDQLTQKDIKLG